MSLTPSPRAGPLTLPLVAAVLFVWSPPSGAQTAGEPWRSDSTLLRVHELRASFAEPLERGVRAGAETLRLELFEGRRATARRVRTGSAGGGAGRVWLGRLDSDPAGYAAFAVHGEALVGVAVEHGVLYRLRRTSSGGIAAYQCDTSALPGCDGAAPWPRPPQAPSARTAGGAGSAAAQAGATVVDLIVGWTEEAEDSIGSQSAVLATIDLALLETNQALADSGVALEVRLAYAAEVTYLETGDMQIDLARLQDPMDGHMDEVHGWRDLYGADAVSLLVDNGTKCGRSYNMGAPASPAFAPWAFSLVSKDCVTGVYALAHELGHGFGLDHDRPNTKNVPSHPFAYGHHTADGSLRTIMALQRTGSSAVRVPYFSNPDVVLGGQPLGVPIGTPGESDCAAALELNAAVVAGWRAETTVSYCTAGTSASGCTATISALGIPSATDASGFQLAAEGVEGGKDGLFFLGTGGRQANPWGNGSSLQCVVPPVFRGGLLPGTGTSGQCDGAPAQDWNALWCPTCPRPAKNPGAGAVVQAQLWYRDPLSSSNQTTSLSDAIEFVVRP